MTRTIRGIPTEIRLGPDEGLPADCVATFDSLQPVPRWALTERAGRLGAQAQRLLCAALGAMADC